MLNNVKYHRGLTLAEVLVATFVFLLCSTAVLSTWLCVRKMYTTEVNTIDARRELRLALHKMNNDFKLAEMIYTGRTFTHNDTNGASRTYEIEDPNVPGQSMAVAIPSVDTEGVRNGNYLVIGYILQKQDNTDPLIRLNPNAQQLTRFQYRTTTGTSFSPIDPYTINLQTAANHSSTIYTVLCRFIEPDGIEFCVNSNSRGIKTAAVKVQKQLPNIPPVQQRIESGYFLRNNR